MQFVSTRGKQPVNLDTALVNGIADDGGLYVPTELPRFDLSDFALKDLSQLELPASAGS